MHHMHEPHADVPGCIYAVHPVGVLWPTPVWVWCGPQFISRCLRLRTARMVAGRQQNHFRSVVRMACGRMALYAWRVAAQAWPLCSRRMPYAMPFPRLPCLWCWAITGLRTTIVKSLAVHFRRESRGSPAREHPHRGAPPSPQLLPLRPRCTATATPAVPSCFTPTPPCIHLQQLWERCRGGHHLETAACMRQPQGVHVRAHACTPHLLSHCNAHAH